MSIKCGHCGDRHTSVIEIKACAVPRPQGAAIAQGRQCKRCSRHMAAHEVYASDTLSGNRCLECCGQVFGAKWSPLRSASPICQGGYQIEANRLAEMFAK